MTIHPDVSGRPHVLLMHERYVQIHTIRDDCVVNVLDADLLNILTATREWSG